MKSYDDILIQHAKHPVGAVAAEFRGFGEDGGAEAGSNPQSGADGGSELRGADVASGFSGTLTGYIEHRNRSCGDVVKLWWGVRDGVLTHIVHHAAGCMLCKASASILCETVAGKPLHQLDDLIAHVERITRQESTAEPTSEPTVPPIALKTGKPSPSTTPTVPPIGLETETPSTTSSPPEIILALSQVRDFPTRRKCITLAWEALSQTLQTDP